MTEWPRSSRRTAQRRTLSQALIVRMGLELLNKGNIDAVSMRQIAQALNTGAASLYAHVSNKEELYELMLDELLGALDIPEPEPDRWQEQIKQLARQQLRVLTDYPGIARVALETIVPTGPNSLRLGEGMLAILRAGGLSDRAAVLAFDTVSLWCAAFAYEVSSGQTEEEMDQEAIAQRSAQIGLFIASRAAEFPNLASVGRVMSEATAEERFEFALNTFLAGLANR